MQEKLIIGLFDQFYARFELIFENPNLKKQSFFG
jgi:hypothetical protein